MTINIPQGNFQIVPEYGRMQIFGVGADYNVYTMWKITTDPDSAWSDWTDMGGGTAGIADDATVAVGYLPDGRMQIFGVGNDHHVYSLWKVTADPNSLWSAWQSLDGSAAGAVIGIGYLPDQRIQLFVMGLDGTFQSCWKITTDSNSDWSGWASIGAPPGGAGVQVSVGYLPDSRMQLFVLAGDGALYSMWKTSTDPDSSWTAWQSMGLLPGNNPPGTLSLAVGYLPDGRMQLFVVSNDQALYSAWKAATNPDSSWSSWADMGQPENAYLNNVSVGYLPDGRMQLFTPDNRGTVYSRWKTTTDPDSSWSGWVSMGGEAEIVEYISAVGYLTDGRMQLFAAAVEPAYSVCSAWKTTTAPGSSWSDWTSMGPAPGGGLPNGVQVGYLPSEEN
jgi:hypothetical protein